MELIDCLLPDTAKNKECHFTLFFDCEHYVFYSISMSQEFLVRSIRSFLEDPCHQPEDINRLKQFSHNYRIFEGLPNIESIQRKYSVCHSDGTEDYIIIVEFIDDNKISKKKIHNLNSFELVIWNIFDLFDLLKRALRD